MLSASNKHWLPAMLGGYMLYDNQNNYVLILNESIKRKYFTLKELLALVWSFSLNKSSQSSTGAL